MPKNHFTVPNWNMRVNYNGTKKNEEVQIEIVTFKDDQTKIPYKKYDNELLLEKSRLNYYRYKTNYVDIKIED